MQNHAVVLHHVTYVRLSMQEQMPQLVSVSKRIRSEERPVSEKNKRALMIRQGKRIYLPIAHRRENTRTPLFSSRYSTSFTGWL